MNVNTEEENENIHNIIIFSKYLATSDEFLKYVRELIGMIQSDVYIKKIMLQEYDISENELIYINDIVRKITSLSGAKLLDICSKFSEYQLERSKS